MNLPQKQEIMRLYKEEISLMDVNKFKHASVTVEWSLFLGEVVLFVYSNRPDCPDNAFSWLVAIIEKLFEYREEDDVRHFYTCVWRRVIAMQESMDNMLLMTMLIQISPCLLGDQLVKIASAPYERSPTTEEELRALYNEEFGKVGHRPWLRLCFSDSSVFQITANFINEAMVMTKGDDIIVRMFLSVFLKHARGYCALKKIKFYSLYGEDDQKWVKMMLKKPGENCELEKELLEELSNGLVMNRLATSLLLSHFPEWAAYLCQHCANNGEAFITNSVDLDIDS